MNQDYLIKLSDFHNVSIDYILNRVEADNHSDFSKKPHNSTKNNWVQPKATPAEDKSDTGDSFKDVFESVGVLRRASKEMSPAARKKMLELIEDFLKED